MTTASWSTPIDQTTDAGFRTWGLELNGKFSAVGLIQTADTGQINWTTVTRAAAGNNAAGYEIWKLSDSSLFFKIEYGSGAAQTNPALWITVGTGSNGSGTITGQSAARRQTGGADTVNNTATAVPSYLCATTAFFGLAFKVGQSTTVGVPSSLWAVGKTVDATGTPTTIGYYRLGRQGTTTSVQAVLQSVRLAATAATEVDSTNYCVFVGTPTNSSDGTNNQVYLHMLNVPGVQPALYTGTVISSEVSQGTTISVTLVGSTPHTYICVCSGTFPLFDAGSTSIPKLAMIMLWE